jgi:hypothetical protein
MARLTKRQDAPDHVCPLLDESFYGDEGEWTKDNRIEAIDGCFLAPLSLVCPAEL